MLLFGELIYCVKEREERSGHDIKPKPLSMMVEAFCCLESPLLFSEMIWRNG